MNAEMPLWAVGDFVRIGNGPLVLVIVCFWGDSGQIARLQGVERSWVYQSANIGRLVAA